MTKGWIGGQPGRPRPLREEHRLSDSGDQGRHQLAVIVLREANLMVVRVDVLVRTSVDTARPGAEGRSDHLHASLNGNRTHAQVHT